MSYKNCYFYLFIQNIAINVIFGNIFANNKAL